MKPTHEQAGKAIKEIIEMLNANGPDIGHYVEHFTGLMYNYKTSKGEGQMSPVSVNEKALEGVIPDSETLELIRKNFMFDEEEKE